MCHVCTKTDRAHTANVTRHKDIIFNQNVSMRATLNNRAFQTASQAFSLEQTIQENKLTVIFGMSEKLVERQ